MKEKGRAKGRAIELDFSEVVSVLHWKSVGAHMAGKKAYNLDFTVCSCHIKEPEKITLLTSREAQNLNPCVAAVTCLYLMH